MRFLSGPDIQAEVRQLASRSGAVMAAVAYWGKGAAERTGLAENDRPESVRVICDLLSGACNPAEIETLVQLGVTVRTLDRLHAKVWIASGQVIVGSANASHNGLPEDDEEAANASIEAAVLSRAPSLTRQLAVWFEDQWCASSAIEDWHLHQARDMWSRRHRSGGRGFTAPLTDKIRKPASLDRFHSLRLLAYLPGKTSTEAVNYVNRTAAGLHFSDEEWREFGHEKPWYEWPLNVPEWKHQPGTVFMDFSRAGQRGNFTFNGFWQIRDCPTVKLNNVRLRLLTKLPHFNGYSLTKQEEKDIVRRIRKIAAQRNYQDDKFGFYIDERFLEFWDDGRAELRQILVDQVAEAARELCRNGQFDPSLTLRAIRTCKEDPEWLTGYARFVGGGIYDQANPLKSRINPAFALKVKSAVDAKVQKGKNGKSVERDVENEIIQSYTLFEDYNPEALETP